MIALVVVGVVVLAAVGVALFLFLGRGERPPRPASARTPPRRAGRRRTPAPFPTATGTPEGLGDDPLLDDARDRPATIGDMQSCDDLFDESDAGSDYETYGDTCAGRQPPGTLAYCTETFPES